MHTINSLHINKSHSLAVSLQYTGYTIFYDNAQNFLLLPSVGRPLWQGVVVWGGGGGARGLGG